MKDYVVPYVVGMHGEWWAGIDIYNHHTHYHFTTRGVDKINWDFDVRDFVQRK